MIRINHTGVYANILLGKDDNPLPSVSDDKKVTYSHPPDIDFSDPTRFDDTKLDEQDFDEQDVEVLFS